MKTPNRHIASAAQALTALLLCAAAQTGQAAIDCTLLAPGEICAQWPDDPNIARLTAAPNAVRVCNPLVANPIPDNPPTKTLPATLCRYFIRSGTADEPLFRKGADFTAWLANRMNADPGVTANPGTASDFPNAYGRNETWCVQSPTVIQETIAAPPMNNCITGTYIAKCDISTTPVFTPPAAISWCPPMPLSAPFPGVKVLETKSYDNTGYMKRDCTNVPGIPAVPAVPPSADNPQGTPARPAVPGYTSCGAPYCDPPVPPGTPYHNPCEVNPQGDPPDDPPTCANTCPAGQTQNPPPNCSCIAPPPTCSNHCKSGETQNPAPDCKCIAQPTCRVIACITEGATASLTPVNNKCQRGFPVWEASCATTCPAISCPTGHAQGAHPNCQCVAQISSCPTGVGSTTCDGIMLPWPDCTCVPTSDVCECVDGTVSYPDGDPSTVCSSHNVRKVTAKVPNKDMCQGQITCSSVTEQVAGTSTGATTCGQWTPTTDSQDLGVSFTQSRNCSNTCTGDNRETRPAVGTKPVTGTTTRCTAWRPKTSSQCQGAVFEQSSTCTTKQSGADDRTWTKTQSATGTKRGSAGRWTGAWQGSPPAGCYSPSRYTQSKNCTVGSCGRGCSGSGERTRLCPERPIPPSCSNTCQHGSPGPYPGCVCPPPPQPPTCSNSCSYGSPGPYPGCACTPPPTCSNSCSHGSPGPYPGCACPPPPPSCGNSCSYGSPGPYPGCACTPPPTCSNSCSYGSPSPYPGCACTPPPTCSNSCSYGSPSPYPGCACTPPPTCSNSCSYGSPSPYPGCACTPPPTCSNSCSYGSPSPYPGCACTPPPTCSNRCTYGSPSPYPGCACTPPPTCSNTCQHGSPGPYPGCACPPPPPVERVSCCVALMVYGTYCYERCGTAPAGQCFPSSCP